MEIWPTEWSSSDRNFGAVKKPQTDRRLADLVAQLSRPTIAVAQRPNARNKNATADFRKRFGRDLFKPPIALFLACFRSQILWRHKHQEDCRSDDRLPDLFF